MPAACSACRCCEVLAVDCPLAPRELVDAARRLREQVEQLEPARAGERLAHQRDRLEQRVLRGEPAHPRWLFNRSLDSLSSHVLPTAAQRRNRVRLLSARLQDATASSRSSTRTSTWSTTTSRWPRRRACRSSPCFETHVQADHVSGLPELVERTGATAYLPEGAGVEFEHHALADGEVVELGNTEMRGDRHARARAGASRLPRHRPRARRRAVVRADRRRAAGRRRRAARPARARRAHASRRWRARSTAR